MTSDFTSNFLLQRVKLKDETEESHLATVFVPPPLYFLDPPLSPSFPFLGVVEISHGIIPPLLSPFVAVVVVDDLRTLGNT